MKRKKDYRGGRHEGLEIKDPLYAKQFEKMNLSRAELAKLCETYQPSLTRILYYDRYEETGPFPAKPDLIVKFLAALDFSKEDADEILHSFSMVSLDEILSGKLGDVYRATQVRRMEYVKQKIVSFSEKSLPKNSSIEEIGTSNYIFSVAVQNAIVVVLDFVKNRIDQKLIQWEDFVFFERIEETCNTILFYHKEKVVLKIYLDKDKTVAKLELLVDKQAFQEWRTFHF